MSAPALDRPAPGGAPALRPPPALPPGPPLGRSRRALLYTATAAGLLGALLVGFALYVLAASGLQEQHSQATLYRTLRGELGQGVAQIGPAADGSPVAVLDIPAIGLRSAVVVEGTTARDLMRGPGHRRDSALPGQTGVSVLDGRRGAFGAPFGHLPALRAGDLIHVTTGQGRFTYTVNAFGDGSHPISDPAAARLVLTTADSTWVPTRTLLVGARLDGAAQPNPGGRPAIVAADHALAWDDSALGPLQLWSLALLAAVCLATLAARMWQRRAAYLVFTPVLAALCWCVYENAAALLPNLY